MRPNFYDFVNLFENNITVNYIASSLENYEKEKDTKKEALKRMKDKDFNQMGVSENGGVHMVLTKSGEERPIKLEEIISESMSIEKLIDLSD